MRNGNTKYHHDASQAEEEEMKEEAIITLPDAVPDPRAVVIEPL